MGARQFPLGRHDLPRRLWRDVRQRGVRDGLRWVAAVVPLRTEQHGVGTHHVMGRAVRLGALWVEV
jgi:hypothetical protein